jgi:two-component system, OmpR family, phosphate regulon sensor histidine kinase PhoR
MGPEMARHATRFELSSSVVGPLRRLATGQRAQRRTSGSVDSAYDEMVQAYVRTARELREEREANRTQEALNVAVIESAHDAFVSIDANDTIIAWNTRAEELFGWPAPIAIGRLLARTIIPPAARAMHRRGLEQFLATGEDRVLNRRLELTALHRDGSEIPVDMTITPLRIGDTYRFYAFISDATARRRAIRHREAQHGVVLALAQASSVDCALSGALEAIGSELGWELAAFWSADRARGVLRCEQAWHADGDGLAHFAVASRGVELASGEGLPGRAWGEDRAIWLDNLQRERNLPRMLAASRAQLLTAISVPVRCEGELVGALEVFSTQSRHREPDLLAILDAIGAQLGQFVERKRAEAESERVKNEFFALVSHELRTPLTAIMGYVELLRDEVELDAQGRHFVDVVDRNAERLLGLIGDVLFVTQLEAGRFELQPGPVALDEIVRAAVEIARPRAQAGAIELRTSLDAIPPLLADRERLHQLVDHLIANALKFTPPGGQVDVALEREDGAVLLTVSDTGIGIAEDEQEHLFERFFRTSEATERAVAGAGLGLTVCKAIAEGHGGQIGVTSRAGAGTVVRVRLPAHPAVADGVAGAPGAQRLAS